MDKTPRGGGFAGVSLFKPGNLKADEYSKTRVQIHPKEGLKVETYASPFVRACIGISLVLVALGMMLLMAAPFVKAWM